MAGSSLPCTSAVSPSCRRQARARTIVLPPMVRSASNSSMVRPGRSVRTSISVSSSGMSPRISKLRRAMRMPSRGSCRISASVISPLTGAMCCSSGRHAPCTEMLGR